MRRCLGSCVAGEARGGTGQSRAPWPPGARRARSPTATEDRGLCESSVRLKALASPAVIKMEGGTEHDLKVLDQEEEEERPEKAEPGKKEENRLPEQERKVSTEKEEKKEEAKKAKVGRGGGGDALGCVSKFVASI